MGSEFDIIGGLKEKKGKLSISLSLTLSPNTHTHTHPHTLAHPGKGKAKWEHKVKSAISKPERKLSPGPDHPGP